MATHAPGERQLVRNPDACLPARVLRPVAVIREQVIACSLRCLEVGVAGPEALYGQLESPSSDTLWVREVRHAVGPHAAGESDECVLWGRRGCGSGGGGARHLRRAAAATAGREHRERADGDDGSEDEWTARTHDVQFLS